MSSTVPDGWSIKSLNGHIDILSGFPFKSSLFCDDPSLIGVIRIRDLLKQSIETFYSGNFDDAYIVERGDILIGMDGDFNIVKWKAKDALLNQRICKVKAFSDKGFDTDFLFHSLVEDLDSIHAATGATTVKHLSVKDIRGIEKAYPPLPEQQKIAAILSSVDDVIEKTRAQIDKLKDLKTGMMQALLTKGIGHTAFKDSPVGQIPEGWEVVQVGELFEDRVELTNDEDTYVLSSLTIEHGLVKKPERYVRDFLIADKGKDSYKIVYPGDFLFNPMNLRWGAIARSNNEAPVIVSKYYNILKPKVNCDVRFYEHAFKSELYLQRYENIAVGTLIEKKRVHWSSLKEMLVPRPTDHELEDMGAKIDSLVSAARLKESKLRLAQDLKKALMQDLLTGKVRVNVHNNNNSEDRVAV